jgi:hypothetical protein
MEKNIKIILVLSVFLIISCKGRKLYFDKDAELNIPELIIEDLNRNYKSNFLDKTNVVIIAKYDSLNNDSFIYGVFDKPYLNDIIIVRPDSVNYTFNNFKEINNRLYIWEDNNIVKKPSEVFKVLHKYKMPLDSCKYKHYYKEKNLDKLTKCQKYLDTIYPKEYNDIYYITKLNEKDKFVKIKTTRKYKNW